MADEAINLKFSLADVTTHYFKDLPVIRAASGSGVAQGNRFDLKLDSGAIELNANDKIALTGASMTATNLLSPVTSTQYIVDAKARASAVLDYMNLPALNLLSRAEIDKNRLDGDAEVNLTLSILLPKDGSKETVSVSAKAKVTDASVKKVFGDLDLEKGAMSIDVSGGSFKASGPARIGGIPVKIQVARDLTGATPANTIVEAELTDEQRAKFMPGVNDFVRGPIGVKLTLPEPAGKSGKLDIAADLSKASLTIDAISWSRGPVPKTTASLVYERSDKGGSIRDLEIKGGGLSINGEVDFGRKNELIAARFPVVVLSDENRFGFTLKQAEDEISLSVNGRSFDARPMLKAALSETRRAAKRMRSPPSALRSILTASTRIAAKS